MGPDRHRGLTCAFLSITASAEISYLTCVQTSGNTIMSLRPLTGCETQEEHVHRLRPPPGWHLGTFPQNSYTQPWKLSTTQERGATLVTSWGG